MVWSGFGACGARPFWRPSAGSKGWFMRLQHSVPALRRSAAAERADVGDEVADKAGVDARGAPALGLAAAVAADGVEGVGGALRLGDQLVEVVRLSDLEQVAAGLEAVVGAQRLADHEQAGGEV